MKTHYKLISAFLLLFAINSQAQVPALIPYQAVARDAGSNIIPNHLISIRFSIRDLTSGGAILFTETHSTTTNSMGLFNLNIGQGILNFGSFAAINWKTGSKYLQVEMDASGGAAFVNMGTSQMLSVPYALFADKCDDLPDGTANGNTLHWNGTTWISDGALTNNGINVGIGTSSTIAKFNIKGDGSTSSTNSFIVQNSSGDTAMRIRGDGRIGIGYNSVTYGRTLNMGGTGINFYSTSDLFGGAIFPTDTSIVMWSNSNSNNYVVLQPTWGNVGIGTYMPSAKLEVNGTVILGANGSLLTEVLKATVNKDIASIAAGASSAVTFALSSAVIGSSVMISPASALANGLLIAYARVSGAGVIEAKFTNITASAIDPAAMDFYITTVR